LASNERYRQVLAAWAVRDEDGDDDAPSPGPDVAATLIERGRAVRQSADEDVV
jgi:hypothetical protein